MSNTRPTHIRRPTWPPTLQLMVPSMSKNESKPHNGEQQTDDVDEDPFSHFLSPVLDEDDPFDGAEYSAGIEPIDDEIETKRTNFRARLEQRWETFMSHCQASRSQDDASRTPPSEDQLPDLVNDISPPNGPSIFDEELDGWEADRLRRRTTFGFPLQRPRLKTSRTLSGRKHSYAEPSPQLWTLDEESESQETIKAPLRGRAFSR